MLFSLKPAPADKLAMKEVVKHVAKLPDYDPVYPHHPRPDTHSNHGGLCGISGSTTMLNTTSYYIAHNRRRVSFLVRQWLNTFSTDEITDASVGKYLL